VVRPVFKTATEKPSAAPVGSIPTRSRHPPCGLTKTLLLVNPAAGRGRAGRLKDRVLTACRSSWSDVTLMETTAPGDGVDRARHAAEAGVERVLVLGGDGAVHEAANGILTARTSALPALGVFPVGTGNDYAKLTGTAGLRIEQAASRLHRGKVRSLDVGCMAGEYFVNAAGVGFDWPDAGAVFAKLEEETAELRGALAGGDRAAVREEVGDLLFTVANLARKLDVDPEAALAGTNRKFRERFGRVEEGLAARGKTAGEATLEEMDALWEAAKGEG